MPLTTDTARPKAVDTTAIARIEEVYTRSVRRRIIFGVSLGAALTAAVVLAIVTGAASISAAESLYAVAARLFPWTDGAPVSDFTAIVVYNLRLPRIVMAIAGGAGFAIAGGTMQGVLRNPLVSPYILGLSQAAAFGAGLAIVFNWGFIAGEYVIILNAFIFGCLAMLLVYGISSFRGVTPETVILAGVAVGYLFSALVSCLWSSG